MRPCPELPNCKPLVKASGSRRWSRNSWVLVEDASSLATVRLKPRLPKFELWKTKPPLCSRDLTVPAPALMPAGAHEAGMRRRLRTVSGPDPSESPSRPGPGRGRRKDGRRRSSSCSEPHEALTSDVCFQIYGSRDKLKLLKLQLLGLQPAMETEEGFGKSGDHAIPGPGARPRAGLCVLQSLEFRAPQF